MGDVKDPIKPEELIKKAGEEPKPGDPLAMALFGKATKVAKTEFIPKDPTGSRHYSFNPHADQFEYIPNATTSTTDVDYFNSKRQSVVEKAGRGIVQFGANVLSSVGQGLANTFDMISLGKTIRGEITGSDDDFTSSFLGVSTKDMQDWTNGIAKRNKIYESNPGSFDPSNFGWWMTQFASSGTGVGMALEAIGTTVAIEALSGGTGTGAALTKLGNLFNRIGKGEKGLEVLKTGFDAASGLKSAATLYGTISRYSESRMEASQSYDDIYNELSAKKDANGNEQFSEEEKKHLSSQGARRTFNNNLALLPLDILAFRTMMYNPISGSGTGLIERQLGKIGNKYIRKGVQGTLFASLEGTEEAFQFVGSEEGKHYARVLAGMDDGSTFLKRLGQDVKKDEFWNNFAGGVIGSPIIMGANSLVNKAMTGNRTARMNQIHTDYVQNIGKMDDAVGEKIVALQQAGKEKEADILRRQFRANKALSALHLDAMTDKDSAFESHMAFLEGTLEEVNSGKFDALVDLGFADPTAAQVDYIKANFQKSIDDAKEMKVIYDNVKNKYNKNFVPEIAQAHFSISRLSEAQAQVNQKIGAMQGTLHQFGQLSSQGKSQYDAEYQLESLFAEQQRLTEKFRTTDNSQEKENINQLIQSNKNKVTALREKLIEVGKDDTYTPEQRETDKDILDSALRDSDYSQAMYEKEYIENTIAIQRKNLSLWNSAEYQKSKAEESISKAKTKAQVEATEEHLNTTGTNTTETAEQIANKKAELAAQEAAEIAKQQIAAQQQARDNAIPGNGNLFDDDNQLINSITQQANLNPVIDEGNWDNNNPEFLFSPAKFDFENSTDDAKNKIIHGVRGLIDKIGNSSSFEDLVRHIIKVQGEGVADNIFNALKWGWEKVGMKAEDYDAIYNKIFGNPLESLLSGVQELAKVEEDVLGKQEGPKQFDNNNQPVYQYEGIITNEASPKMAFSTRLSQLIQNVNEDGSISVSYEYTEDELNIGDYVDSLQLLDPDQYNEGVEMEIRVPTNFMSIKIPVFNTDGTKGTTMTFGQYVAEKNLSPDSQEFRDKIPMIMYRKGSPTTEKGLAFVHDIGWYHPLRFNQDKKDDMENAIANTRAIRDEVLTDKGNKTEVVITGKRQTTFAGLKTKKDETISLREANPETKITVALTTDSLSTGKGLTAFPNNGTELVNNSPFKVGQVLEVRRYGMKGGVKTFIAFPVFRPKLDEVSKVSVIQAVNIYANRSNTSADVRQRHDGIIKQIQDTMGLDILNPQGLEKYLQHFISTFNTEKAKSNKDVEAQAAAKLTTNTPYIAFIAGGNIVFGITGQAAYATKEGKQMSYFINPNSPAVAGIALKALTNERMMGWYEQNVNLDNLNRNKPVVVIDKALTASVAAISYNDFLLDRLKTNIKSHNIGTAENPNYVTNIQPVITYELKSKLAQGLPTNQEVKTTLVNENEGDSKLAETETGKVPDISDLEREIIEQAKRDLGSDFGISKDNDYQFSPAKLTDEQRDNVAETINRIAGLTPDQQFDITDFMYNQITAMVNLDTKQVTRDEVDAQVEQAFKDVISPIKEHLKQILAHNEGLLVKHPGLQNSKVPETIEGYKYRIAKIQAIEDSFDILKEEAYNRVAKYTGITENKTQNESKNDNVTSLEDLDLTVEDEGNEREVDFWTDVLTENPENKLSYSMRRFFGQIREYDKNGGLVTGFLGLPSYTGADEVARTLMVTLADVPSSFETMMAKLESRKDAIPWMQEVINKLNGASQQKKNQFVTVMSNTALRMKFTMISFNRRASSYTTKVWDTNLSGVADSVKKEWAANLKDSELVIVNSEGQYTLNVERAKHLIRTFEDWKGVSLKEVEGDLSVLESVRARVKNNNPNVAFTPTGTMAQWLKTNVVKNSDRVKLSMTGKDYQITKLSDGKFQMSFLKDTTANNESVSKWLSEFGINLHPKTLEELMTKGLYHNYAQRKPNELFVSGVNTNGLFGILYNNIKGLVESGGAIFDEEGNSPIQDTVIGSLATLEAKYNESNTPFGFRDNGKSLFALTAPKFITDRVRDLKTVDSAVREQLMTISFSKNSMWLNLMTDPKFRDKFNVSHIGLNAFKELGKKLHRDNGITKLADADHELTKLGMFWDTTQGEVRYVTKDAKGEDISLTTYPDTSVVMIMATMFSPTMSDKSLMTLITTAVLSLQNADLNNGQGISDAVTKILYEQTVKPELLRMIKFYQNGGKTDISGYDKGAGMFLFMPEMNNIEYTPGLKLIDAIKYNPNDFTQTFIEGNQDIMDTFNQRIKEYVTKLTKEKVEVWEKNGLIAKAANETKLYFFDKKYMDKFRGDNNEKAQMAAMDFVVNSLIANANSFMTMAGDPALYFKSKAADPLTMAKDTFTNVGKRLANQVAPGTTLSNSETEKYIQLFLEDRISIASNIAYLEKLLGKEGAASYRKLEGSDAQEYTTWKEHLDILAKLGKTPDNLSDITPEEIAEARELFSSDSKKLTEKQMQLIGKVMQPIKPVYTGQIYDAKQDAMRTVYIKSSSFPLIPQLTAGMEIDKLRLKMESLEKSSKLNVRASYQTANKVGSINTPAKIWSEDGNINDEALNDLAASSLVLDRKNLRIQQEIPFKSGKTGEDKITLGTQLMKLLFGDEIMKYGGFLYNGKQVSGSDLHKLYNDTFIQLVQEKRNQLFTELGLDNQGMPVDKVKSMQKLQTILKEEAVKRGYPLQDIQGLTLNSNGEFNLPLWASTNSNRYESMLNAIVTNRLIRMKFPGNSFVVGSEEGFVKQDTLEGVDQSRIIYTSAWNGKSLMGTTKENGELKKAQVLIASKFKDAKGNLIDLFTKVNGEYKYITKTDTGSFLLKENMFDKDLLSHVSFRIPTSGHQSASQIEVVGFLPFENGDLMIVPRNFTKQKGLDFDVDKENSYALWNYMTEDGKFEILNESHRDKILLAADKSLRDAKISELVAEYKSEKSERVKANILAKINAKIAENNLINNIFVDNVKYEEEDIEGNKYLTKLNSKINEKIMQNEIIKINHSVFGNDNDEIQRKIAKTLNTDFAEEQAEFIEKLSNSNKDDTYWTPLSDEYQKQKMIAGASGKIGTGAYSLDVVGHSLFQQAAYNGKPITLIEVIDDDGKPKAIPKIWKFGSIESTGQLGNPLTLDGDRSIAEVMSERQNVAVDNEKLQVMGRVNLNDLTMDVDKVMNMLGFDKGTDGNSISFLFLSQPIIKEYVEKMKNASSNMAEFDMDKEGTVVDSLIAKYDGANQESINDDYWKRMSSRMTNQNFITEVESDMPDGTFQAAILRRFIEMKAYGIAIRGIQTTINTDSKGLGKSFFDVIEKRNALNRIGIDTNMITGASGLIGDYLSKEEMTNDQIAEKKEDGYVDIGKFLVKPDTLSGGFNIYGVSTAYNLWNKYFPFDAAVTQKAFTEILSIVGSENMGEVSTIEYKQDIFKGMKKYFAASKNNGVISTTDDINAERERLYIDSETNTSLAKYIKALKQINGNPIINAFIKTNKLFNRFEFDIQKNGQPSLIKFNNAAGEEFDEQYLYESLSVLLERGRKGDIELPQIGNKKYTLDTLAQDLIAYAYLGNATQEAIQFTKYTPVAYLNQVGFSKKMREANLWLQSNPNVLGMRVGNSVNESHLVSEYTMQYIQHNPEKVKGEYKDAKKLLRNIVDANSNNLDDLQTFKLKGEDNPTFISTYNSSIPKGEKKFQLYWFDGEKYSRIPILGTFGMDEYQPRNSVGKSVVNGKMKLKVNPQPAINQQNEPGGNSIFNIESKDIFKVVDGIAKSSSEFAELAKILLPYADGVTMVISDTMEVRGKEARSFYGGYNKNTKTIIIHPSILNKPEILADTVLHELVHHLTINSVHPHIEIDGKDVNVKENAPSYVVDLVRLYNTIQSMQGSDAMDNIAKAMVGVFGAGIEDGERAKYYGLTDIYEFMAMAVGNKEFQKELNKIQYKQSGKTLLEKFKEIVKNILTSFGVKFDENSAATAALNTIFEIIDKTNLKVTDNAFGGMYDGSINEDTSFLDNIDNELGNDNPDFKFSPMGFNKTDLLNQAKAEVTKSVPKYLQEAFLSDVETGLAELASQLNSSKSEASTARKMYGNELSDIALKLYPNETVVMKQVRDYISKLSSNQIDC